MKIGFSLSNNQGIEDVQEILRLAVRAEELGFDSVWASEHVFNVSYVQERIGNRPYYEPLTILTGQPVAETTIWETGEGHFATGIDGDGFGLA